MFPLLKNKLPQLYAVADKYAHLFRYEEIPSKSILLREGEVSRRMIFIEQGCIRVWFNNQGKDVTVQFFFEGQGVSSSESFHTGQPSLFTMETIEPCHLHSISRDGYLAILNNEPQVKKEMEDFTYLRWFHYQKLFLSRIKDNPQQRYRQLVADSPHIISRIPQQYIASYLGITAVSLSRIKNKLEREK